MTILIETEAKEIAELLTLLFTARERLSDEKRDRALQKFFAEMKAKPDVGDQSTFEPLDR